MRLGELLLLLTGASLWLLIHPEPTVPVVRTSGVTVELVDSTRRPSRQQDPYFFIVHAEDIQALVDELRARHAKRITVNGLPATRIRFIGPTILVGNTRLAPPYVVQALGNGPKLQQALEGPNGFRASMATQMQMGVEVTIRAD